MIVSMLSLAICIRALAKSKLAWDMPIGMFILAGLVESFVYVIFAIAIMMHAIP